MNDETDPDRNRAPALDKGHDILELLASVDAGPTQAEIAKALGRSPNENYRMLDRLCAAAMSFATARIDSS
jgi:hypothetical protein